MVFWTLAIAFFFAVGFPLITVLAYMAVSPLARRKEAGTLDETWWGWKIAGRIALAIGWPGDVCFNALYGSIIFRTRPRELTFSSRVQDNIDVPPDAQAASAAFLWGTRLNQIWPGHIRMEPRR